MELFFRKYFWTVNVAFVLAVSFIAARTVNLLTEVALQPSLASLTARPSTRSMAVDPPMPVDLTRLYALTGLPVPAPEPNVNEPGAPYDPNAEPVRTSLRLKLLGTLVSASEEWSVASVQDLAASPQKVGTYMIGDKIQTADVLEIERSRVVIKNNGRKEYIDNETGDGAGAPPIPTSKPVALNDVPNSNIGDGIKEVGENTYTVPRAEIDKTLSNLNEVAMQARIVPAFKDGVAQGFKLFSIRQDSIYSKIGVLNGDVIKRINGYEMNSPEKALEVYSKLKDASRIDIELERNGTNVHKTYNVH